MVADYLKTSRVEIKFLPPYSPDLNLIERLWRFMNKKVRNNRYYEKFVDFKTEIYSFFEKFPKYRKNCNLSYLGNFLVPKLNSKKYEYTG
jgi:transposase